MTVMDEPVSAAAQRPASASVMDEGEEVLHLPEDVLFDKALAVALESRRKRDAPKPLNARLDGMARPGTATSTTEDVPEPWAPDGAFFHNTYVVKWRTGPVRNAAPASLKVVLFGKQAKTDELVLSLLHPASESTVRLRLGDALGPLQQIELSHTNKSGFGVLFEEITVADMSTGVVHKFEDGFWLHSEKPGEVARQRLRLKGTVSGPRDFRAGGKVTVIKLAGRNPDDLAQYLAKLRGWCVREHARCVHISLNRAGNAADAHIIVDQVLVAEREERKRVLKGIVPMFKRGVARNHHRQVNQSVTDIARCCTALWARRGMEVLLAAVRMEAYVLHLAPRVVWLRISASTAVMRNSLLRFWDRLTFAAMRIAASRLSGIARRAIIQRKDRGVLVREARHILHLPVSQLLAGEARDRFNFVSKVPQGIRNVVAQRRADAIARQPPLPAIPIPELLPDVPAEDPYKATAEEINMRTGAVPNRSEEEAAQAEERAAVPGASVRLDRSQRLALLQRAQPSSRPSTAASTAPAYSPTKAPSADFDSQTKANLKKKEELAAAAAAAEQAAAEQAAKVAAERAATEQKVAAEAAAAAAAAAAEQKAAEAAAEAAREAEATAAREAQAGTTTSAVQEATEEELSGAALKIQARQRGVRDRKRVAELKATKAAQVAAEAAAAAAAAAEAAAAAKEEAELNKAALKIQARQRGVRDRKRVAQLRSQAVDASPATMDRAALEAAEAAKEEEELHRAAMKIQARQRGARDRKRVAELKHHQQAAKTQKEGEMMPSSEVKPGSEESTPAIAKELEAEQHAVHEVAAHVDPVTEATSKLTGRIDVVDEPRSLIEGDQTATESEAELEAASTSRHGSRSSTSGGGPSWKRMGDDVDLPSFTRVPKGSDKPDVVMGAGSPVKRGQSATRNRNSSVKKSMGKGKGKTPRKGKSKAHTDVTRVAAKSMNTTQDSDMDATTDDERTRMERAAISSLDAADDAGDDASDVNSGNDTAARTSAADGGGPIVMADGDDESEVQQGWKASPPKKRTSVAKGGNRSRGSNAFRSPLGHSTSPGQNIVQPRWSIQRENTHARHPRESDSEYDNSPSRVRPPASMSPRVSPQRTRTAPARPTVAKQQRTSPDIPIAPKTAKPVSRPRKSTATVNPARNAALAAQNDAVMQQRVAAAMNILQGPPRRAIVAPDGADAAPPARRRRVDDAARVSATAAGGPVDGASRYSAVMADIASLSASEVRRGRRVQASNGNGNGFSPLISPSTVTVTTRAARGVPTTTTTRHGHGESGTAGGILGASATMPAPSTQRNYGASSNGGNGNGARDRVGQLPNIPVPEYVAPIRRPATDPGRSNLVRQNSVGSSGGRTPRATPQQPDPATMAMLERNQMLQGRVEALIGLVESGDAAGAADALDLDSIGPSDTMGSTTLKPRPPGPGTKKSKPTKRMGGYGGTGRSGSAGNDGSGVSQRVTAQFAPAGAAGPYLGGAWQPLEPSR